MADDTLVNPDNIKIKEYKKGVSLCEITVHELNMLGLFLKSIESIKLDDSQDHLRSLVFNSYKIVYKRSINCNGKLTKTIHNEAVINTMVHLLNDIESNEVRDNFKYLINKLKH